MNKILSIATCVYNKWSFTKKYLEDLSKLPNTHEIIIVDNGSIDDTQKNLQGSTEIIYYRFDENFGFSKGSNRAYNLSTAPNVMFLNNDIRVKENHSSWTQPIIDKCNDGLVGPTMGLLDDNLNFIKEANAYLDGNSYMSGWCLTASKNIWSKLEITHSISGASVDKIDGTDEIFSEEFFAYFEDTDLSFRAKKLSIPMYVVDVPVVHFGRQTSNQLNTYKLYKKSREIFVKKWGK